MSLFFVFDKAKSPLFDWIRLDYASIDGEVQKSWFLHHPWMIPYKMYILFLYKMQISGTIL